MHRLVRRGLLLIASLAYLWTLFSHAVDAWVLENPSEENLQRAIGWNASDPTIWRVHARSRLISVHTDDWRMALRAYEQALARNPFDAFAWEGLASTHARLGNAQASEAALRAGMVAVPHSPSLAWRLANLLVQQQRSREVFPLFRAAASGDPALRPALFELSWKLLADPPRILRELVPDDPESRVQYLRFLIHTKKEPAGAYPVWREIGDYYTEEIRTLGLSFTEELAAIGMGDEALQVWGDLWARPEGATAPPQGNFITNGSFESDLLNAGLDWRLLPETGFEVALDDSVALAGARSLRVTFDGSSNPDFAAVRQWIPVKPGQRYRFRGSIRTDGITTDNGLHFSLATQGAPPRESWERTTGNRAGTTSWIDEQLEFRTGPNTRVLQVQLRRVLSSKLNHLIQGTVWIDNLSIRQLVD